MYKHFAFQLWLKHEKTHHLIRPPIQILDDLQIKNFNFLLKRHFPYWIYSSGSFEEVVTG